MEVSERVVAVARGLERGYGPPVLALRFDSSLDADALVDPVRRVVGSLAGEELHWSVEVEPIGVIVRQWGFVPDVAELLSKLSGALDSAGVPGRMVVHETPPTEASVPLRERWQEVLECHVRVRGERRLFLSEDDLLKAVRRGEEPRAPSVGFFADDCAVLVGIEWALAWLDRRPADAQLWSRLGPAADLGELRSIISREYARHTLRRSRGSAEPDRALRAHPAYGLVEQGKLERSVSAGAWWEFEDAFRSVDLSGGNVSLAGGGAALAGGDWEPLYRQLLGALRAASTWASYGFIKRGRDPQQVGRSLSYDWLPAFQYGIPGLMHFIYEDVLVPDAFGAQLLGPGYSGRIPGGADWQLIELGDAGALLVHRDPAAWFAEPLPPITPEESRLSNPDYPLPEVVVRAREDFADLFITWELIRTWPLDPLSD